MVTSDVPFSVALYLRGSVMSLLLMVMVWYDVCTASGMSMPQAVSMSTAAPK